MAHSDGVLPPFSQRYGSGCGAYTIKGRVVESSVSTLSFVEADDGRLLERGVRGVEIAVYRDPAKPNRERVGRTVTGMDGSFSIPLNAFGAGFLVEEFEINAQRDGYQPVRMSTALPGQKQSLLIMLAPGRGAPPQGEENLMDVYRKYR